MYHRQTSLLQVDASSITEAAAGRTASASPAPSSVFAAPLDQPLVLDLDHTLLRTDVLYETFAAMLRRNPFMALAAFVWMLRGKAVLKRKLAEFSPPAIDLLPVNQAVIDLAEAEAEAGRTVVLATAADELMARRIAARFPCVSEVVASDGRRNLKGAAKAAVLKALYPQGFLYAGDSMADLPIWAEAQEGVAIDPAPRLVRRLAGLSTPVSAIRTRSSDIGIAVKALRLKQWAKNVLVLAPIPLAGLAGSPMAWAAGWGAFLALGLVASATYLLNDLVDLQDDRRHWTKKNRPLASGAMRIDTGLRLAAAFTGLGFVIAGAVGWKVSAVIALYGALTLAYSFRLKRIPILDVATLASLFTLRLFLGVVAVGAVMSPWLFVFSMALFLSLSIAKRHTEVVRMSLHGHTQTSGRGYIARDEPLLLGLGLSAGAAAIVLFSLYLTAEAFRIAAYTMPALLWATPFVLFLWLGRIWLLSQRGELDDDPVAFALKDGVSLALGSVLGLAFLGAMFGGHAA